MPTFQYEAMDNTGREVKDTIDASTQEEAQQLIRQKGFFVTKISERSKAKKKGPAQAKKGGRRGKKKSFTIGKISTKQLCTFTRQLSTLQDAGLPILRSLKILHGQCKPGVLKNSLEDVVEDIESRGHPLRRLRQAPQGVRQALLQHDQGRRGRRCPGGHPPAPGRLQGEVAEPQAADQVGDGLPARGHHRRVRHRRVHPLLHHPQVRGHLQGLRRRPAER